MFKSTSRVGHPFEVYLEHDPARCHGCEHADTKGQGCRLKGGDAFAGMLEMLTRAYGGGVKPGLCEISDSLVHRFEVFMSGATRARGLHRIHLRQNLASGWRHLGCVTLRPHNGLVSDRCPPVADAFLRIPWHMADSPCYSIPVAWYYSAYGGMTPYLCTPYTMHDRSVGYYCAQACVYLCLLMMAAHGGRVFSPTVITALARPRLPDDAESVIRQPYANREDFEVTGLRPSEIAKVASEANLQAHYIVIGPDHLGHRLMCRLIEPYLFYGMPVIIYVWLKNLHPEEVAPHPAEFGQNAQEPDPSHEHSDTRRDELDDRTWDHAIIAIGGSMLWEPIPSQATRIVMHDTATQPYVERSLEQVFRSAVAFGGESSVGFTAFCPSDVWASAHDVMRSAFRDEWFDPSLPRWRIRLIDASFLGQNYFQSITRWVPASAGLPASPLAWLIPRLAPRGRVRRVWAVEQYETVTQWERREPSTVLAYDAGQKARPMTPLFRIGGASGYVFDFPGRPGKRGRWVIMEGMVRTCL